MAASTRARVRSLTRGLSLSTRDTVPAPTPACAATSAMVTTTPSFGVTLESLPDRLAGTDVASDEVSMEPLPRAGDSERPTDAEKVAAADASEAGAPANVPNETTRFAPDRRGVWGVEAPPRAPPPRPIGSP